MIVNCIIDENSIRWHNEKGREFVVDISASDKMLFNEKQILCISKDNETAWAFDENGDYCELNNSDNLYIMYLSKFSNCLAVVASYKDETGHWTDYNYVCDGKQFRRTTPTR